MFVFWLLRFLLIVLVVRAVWRLLAGLIEGLTPPARKVPPKSGVLLVRDPECGTFVVPSRALTLGRGNDVKYFCSERCRQAYSQKH